MKTIEDTLSAMAKAMAKASHVDLMKSKYGPVHAFAEHAHKAARSAASADSRRIDAIIVRASGLASPPADREGYCDLGKVRRIGAEVARLLADQQAELAKPARPGAR